MTEETKSLRYRSNVTRGMAGVFSFEATVDGQGYEQEEILEKLDRFVKALEDRYPAPPPKVKG